MYTLEVYKKDFRCKLGERLVHKADYATTDLKTLENSVRHTWRKDQGFRTEIHKTFVVRRNLMGGGEYEERYDTPRYCSPSSEAYWSM